MLPPYFPPVSRQTAQLINRQGLLFVFNAFRGSGLGFHPHQSLLRGHLPFFVHSRLSPFPVLCMLSPNVLFSSSQFIFNLLLYYYIQIFLKCKPFYNNGKNLRDEAFYLRKRKAFCGYCPHTYISFINVNTLSR